MKNGISEKLGVWLICASVLLLSACVKYLQPDMGAVALDDARVPFVDGRINDAVLATKDLRLEYTLSGNGDTFDITGKLMIDRAILSSYPVLRRFVLRVNFLDAEGIVIGAQDITPNLGSYNTVPDVVPLRADGALPSGTVAIAFNYFGTFAINAMIGLDDETAEAFYMPFE